MPARQRRTDAQTTTRVISGIAQLSAEDGVGFNTDAATAELIREDDGYQGYRVRMPASLATANLKFAVDISVGDPIEPSPQPVQLPVQHCDATLERVGCPPVLVPPERPPAALPR